MLSTELRKLYRHTPNVQDLVLSARSLTDVGVFVADIALFPRLQYLCLSHNSIRDLPADLSSWESLISLDLSNNPITSAASVMNGLQSIKGLLHLKITVPTEQDEAALIVALPSLETFNGVILSEEIQRSARRRGSHYSPSGVESSPSSQVVSTPRDTNRSPTTYNTTGQWTAGYNDKFSKLHGVIYNAIQKHCKLEYGEFNKKSNIVLSHLTNILDGCGDTWRRQAQILRAQQLLHNYCFEIFSIHSPYFDLNFGSAVKALYSSSNEIISQYKELIEKLLEERDKYKDRYTHAENELEQFYRAAATRKEFPTDHIAMQRGVSPGKQEEPRSSNPTASTRHSPALTVPSSTVTAFEGSSPPQRSRSAGYAHIHSSKSRSTPHDLQEGNYRSSDSKDSDKKLPSMNLKQLKEFIGEVYGAKSKYDNKCWTAGVPRETMHQYLYTYLNQRFGIKSIITEYLANVEAAVKQFGSVDNDVAVFEKILRHEINEEFRKTQQHIKDTVQDLLKQQIKQKNIYKNEEEIQLLLNKKMKDYITKGEWTDIVSYMWNEADSVVILSRLDETCLRFTEGFDDPHPEPSTPKRRARRKQQQTSSQISSPGKVKLIGLDYPIFLSVLLHFQMRGHEKYLEPFRKAFRSVDIGGVGVLRPGDVTALAALLAPDASGVEVQRLVAHRCASRGGGSVALTFSDCVALFDEEIKGMLHR